MPNIVIAIISFACGWATGAFLVSEAGLTERDYRRLLGFLAFLVGLILFGITFGEANHLGLAFQVEEALLDQRWCAVVLWVLVGVAVYPFRSGIRQFLTDLTALTLKAPKTTEQDVPAKIDSDQAPRRIPEGEPAADASGSKFLPLSLPWFIEAGLFGAILVAAAVAANPKMLSGLTSFKAGYIEAHFATGGPALQKGQVAVVDANRKSVLSNWNAFRMMDEGHAELYRDLPSADRWRIDFANAYFSDQLSLVFDTLTRREFSYLKLSSENFGLLQDVSTRLSNQIERDIDRERQGDPKNPPERQVFLLKKVSQEIILFRCGTVPDSPDHPVERPKQCDKEDEFKAVTCRATAVSPTAFEKCPAAASYPDSITRIEDHYKGANRDVADNIWDPYVIQAVADLLGRSLGSRERANFLEVTTSFLEDARRNDPCRPSCAFVVPGEASLIYAAVEAKVESEHPWPFDHMFRQVSNLLAQTRRIVDNEQLGVPPREIGRRNRLIDLSLGLQLFYQRALSGQRFTPAEIQSWSEWLKETRAALSVLEDVGLGDEPYMDAGEKAAWRHARPTIERDAALVQDAATSAALSSVLLPAQGNGTAGADCLKARSLMDFASSRNLDKFYSDLRFDRDEKATYEGLIDQMKGRIESECE